MTARRNSGRFVALEDFYSRHQNSGVHRHRLDQVILVSKGIFLFEDSNSRQALYGDLAVFVPAGLRHKLTAARQGVAFQAVLFESGQRAAAQRPRIFHSSNLLRELVAFLNSSEAVRGSPQQKHAIALLRVHLDALLQRGDAAVLRLPVPRDERAEKLVAYIEQNFQRNFSVGELTRVLPLSTRQISRIFQSELGMSVHDYVKAKRIQSAMIALRITRQSIIEVAVACGYDTVSTFYEQFKELAGLAPGEFRRDAR